MHLKLHPQYEKYLAKFFCTLDYQRFYLKESISMVNIDNKEKMKMMLETFFIVHVPF